MCYKNAHRGFQVIEMHKGNELLCPSSNIPIVGPRIYSTFGPPLDPLSIPLGSPQDPITTPCRPPFFLNLNQLKSLMSFNFWNQTFKFPCVISHL